ncbi:MAG: urease accessory protein UreH domain-containing protein [Promethearchaeota archaeon]
MLADVAWGYGPFAFVIWTGFFLGILHTIMPCEDKFIFCFYAFGVSRDWKQAFRIVNFYGFGLFLTNFIIGAILSYISSILGLTLLENFNGYFINALSGITLIISGIIMIFQLKKNRYWPHSEQLQELIENLPTLRSRKRTGFLLGVLAGIPPCIFEIAIYTHASLLSIEYGWGNGLWTIFFFGIGTWLGLIPLAFLGTMSGGIAKFFQKTSIARFQFKFKHIKRKNQILNQEQEDLEIDATNDSEKKHNNFKIENISAGLMIIIGVLLVILAWLNVDIIPIKEIPEVTWPFTPETIKHFWIGLFGLIFITFLAALFNHYQKKKIRAKESEIPILKNDDNLSE